MDSISSETLMIILRKQQKQYLNYRQIIHKKIADWYSYG